MLEDYYDHADFDQLQCYENDFSDYYDDEEEEGKCHKKCFMDLSLLLSDFLLRIFWGGCGK